MIAIFDLDGTIADTLEDIAAAINYGLDRLGLLAHPLERFRQFVGDGLQVLCRRALPLEKADKAERLSQLFSEYYGEHYLDATHLYPGIEEALKELSAADVILAVATNKPQIHARKIVAELLPDIDFDIILGGCPEREKKPDPAMIREIIGSRTDKAYMIGDSNVDILAGKNAGICTIGCTWGFRGRRELEENGADHIAETPGNVVNIILKG